MAKIKAYPEEPSFENNVIDPDSIARKVNRVKSEFFPPWVFTIVLGLVWLLILPGIMAVIASNLLSGGLAGVFLILASVLAVLCYETYSPSWRTIAWAMALSIALSYLCLRIPAFSGKLLVIVIPVGLLVAARTNMNLRKILGKY